MINIRLIINHLLAIESADIYILIIQSLSFKLTVDETFCYTKVSSKSSC